MRKFSSSIILIFLVLLLAQCSFAGTFDPTLGALGARPISLGRAFIGLADDPNALFLNPAGLATLNDEWSATSLYTKLLETVDYRMAGGTYNTEFGSFGLGYVGTSNPAGYSTGSSSDEVYGKMSYDTHTVVLSYGNKMDKIIKIDSLPDETYFGADLKLTSQGFSGADQGGKSGFGFNLDLAALSKVTPWANVGVTINNLIPGTMNWSSGLSENMPMKLNLGSAFNILGPEGMSLYNDSKQTLVGVLDMNIGLSAEEGFTLHGGLEWQPMEYVKVRCGIDQNNISISEGTIGSALNLTAGVGFSYQGITFDYAYHQDSNLEANQNHYFSISYSPVLRESTAYESNESREKSSDYSVLDDGSEIIIVEDGEVTYDEEENIPLIIQEDSKVTYDEGNNQEEPVVLNDDNEVKPVSSTF